LKIYSLQLFNSSIDALVLVVILIVVVIIMGLIVIVFDRVGLRDIVVPAIVVVVAVVPAVMMLGVIASYNRTGEQGRGNVFSGFTVPFMLLVMVCLLLLTVVVIVVRSANTGNDIALLVRVPLVIGVSPPTLVLLFWSLLELLCHTPFASVQPAPF
jgi:hypothetical protein